MDNNTDVYELAESAAAYSGNLYYGLEKIVACLREDRVKEGLNTLAEAVEGFEWLTQAVAGLKAAGGEFSALNNDTIAGFFSEMIDASENMDFVLLADLIEYEILPIIDQWGSKLDEILESRK